MPRPFGFLCLALFASCANRAERPRPPAPIPTVAPLATLELPPAWRTQAPWDFEQAVLSMELGVWSKGDRAVLAETLSAKGQASIRAAVLLGLGGPPSALELLGHLEQRRVEPERAGDAAEVVAARALWRFDVGDVRHRLTLLVVGARPHPDLEIRTECACVALTMGERSVLPFLLRVLHAGTPAQARDPIDWSPKETLAWSKGRASAALSLAAGLPDKFRADGSWADQNEQADILAKALGITN